MGPRPAYYDYTEEYDFDKEVIELFNETVPDLPMPSGFVERLRSIVGGDEKSCMELPATVGADLRPTDALEPSTPVVQRITREMIIAALAPRSELDESDASPAGLELVMNNTVVSISRGTDDSSPADSDFEDSCEIKSATGRSVSAPVSDNGSSQSPSASLATRGGNPIVGVEVMHVAPVVSAPDSLKPKPNPIVATTESEVTIDKIKRHWSLHRAAVGPTRVSSIVAPDIPLRTSSSAASKRSSGGEPFTTVDGSVAAPRSSIADNG
jgi:hypothetical protein